MISPQTLAVVKDRESLFRLLRDELLWPLDPEDPYTYNGPDVAGAASARLEVTQIVPFGADDPFLILLAEFSAPFRRADLREILRSVRRQMRELGRYPGRDLSDIIFICADPGYSGVRFARFQEQEGRQPRLSSFGWSLDDLESTRTLCEVNLPALTLRRNLFDEIDWSEARPRWISAWDVERVTRDFFREYRDVFERVESMVSGVSGDRRLFTQRLLNRLMFLHFLSKKGWLRFNDSTDYLKALWNGRSPGGSFYRTHLIPLFFTGLNNIHIARTLDENPVLQRLIGRVWYLNGGLFVQSADECCGEDVDDAAFDLVINGLFARWNFTVSESTPLDVEVAVDPEMLGKVFEELVTGRHESGSYYTPRPVVSFMCREALKGYLAEDGRESPEALSRFVDEHDVAGLVDPEPILKRLQQIRVCDPACGSGAYLLGMLHELVDLRRCLFNTARVDPITDYHRKLQIIQNNLYGVDIDEFAVNVARLRLWLSLAVEHTAEKPEPLPNLDFKIECGDSLLAPDPGSVAAGGIDMFRAADIKAFEELKAEYADPYYAGGKTDLRKKIDAARQRLTDWLHLSDGTSEKDGASGGFDWWAEFAEVFLTGAGGQGGFDVIVANPPYVRQELIKELKPSLKTVYPEVYTGTADLYCYFYARALQLLRPGGMLAFISSNKWFKAKYGAPLREQIAKTCRVWSITDFGELPVFQTAATFPMIFVAQKGEDRRQPVFTQIKSLDPPYPDVLALQREHGEALPGGALAGAIWTLTSATIADRLRKMERAGTPLGEYPGVRVYRGLITGLNEAFYLDRAARDALTEKDSRSAEIIKPLAVGDDVRRWHIRERDRWIILTRIGVEIERYPAVLEHLRKWQPQLEARWDKGEHWWELRACDYYDEFSKPKIVFPEIARDSRFAYDASGLILNNKAFILPSEGVFLLGVVNSAAAWGYAKFACSSLGDENRGGRLMLQWVNLRRLPIPQASTCDRAAIEALVQKCLDAKGVDCEEWEREIDERVAALYGL